VLELLHLDDLGKALDARHEGVGNGLADGTRERHELRGIELLVAEEDDLVLEKCAPDFGRGDFAREIDAGNLGAERSRDPFDSYCSTLMFCALMIAA
jgi:hypothetical protein